MVDRAYLLEKPKAPSALKRYVDQAAIPAAIDAAAIVESAAEWVANAARSAPLTALAVALGTGIALAAAMNRRRKTYTVGL